MLRHGWSVERNAALAQELGRTPAAIMAHAAGLLMDTVERSVEYPGMADGVIAETVLARWQAFVDAEVVHPADEAEDAIRTGLHVPLQTGTDLAFLEELARRHGFVFRIKPREGRPLACWGPA